jgi:hypothetical protein
MGTYNFIEAPMSPSGFTEKIQFQLAPNNQGY